MAEVLLKEAYQRIEEKIKQYRKEEKKIFATSSFQTHSLPMLHIISRIDLSIPIYFINTGYHFPETIRFRDQIIQQFGLILVDQQPLVPKNLQCDSNGNLYFNSDPDYCCYLNKTQPMEPVMMAHDVWMNGIRADQNANRMQMAEEESAPHDIIRYHPMLKWNNRMIFQYIKEYKIPKHPLEAKGYLSIGCEPCTQKFNLENNREGRWFGLNKTECGLHTDLGKVERKVKKG